jgi:hypothetical protein
MIALYGDDSAVWVPAVALVRIPDMSVGALTHQMYRAKLYSKNRIYLYIKEFQIWKIFLARYI